MKYASHHHIHWETTPHSLSAPCHDETHIETRIASRVTIVLDMYDADIEVGIIWREYCHGVVMIDSSSTMDWDYGSGSNAGKNENNHNNNSSSNNNNNNNSNDENATIHTNNNQTIQPPTTTTTTFQPSSTKYNQPQRTFPTHIITNPLHQQTIHRTPPFHPPKSGPAEIMIGHAAKVTCMEDVQWVLAELLFMIKRRVITYLCINLL